MKKFSLLIIATLLFHCGIKGSPLWIPIDNSYSGKCISITTIESNKNKYKAKIEIHGYNDNRIIINDSIYHQVLFDEPASLSIVGEPSLPIISRLIAIPKGKDFDVRIKDEKWSEDFFVGQVMPRQRSVLESKEEPTFEKNETIYKKDEYQVERFYIGELQEWRGVSNRALNICPIRYRPKEGNMSVLKEFVLEISFDNAAKVNLMKSEDMHLFLNQINTEEYDRVEYQGNSTDSYDYLIIAGNIPGVLGSQALADFRRWKAFKGYRTKVVSTNTIGTSDLQIKQYIKSEHVKGVKYVLLLGNSHWISTHFIPDSNFVDAASDYWYGCMGDSTDVEADINIGRFPAYNLSELTNMINKTISYEGTTRSYGNEVLLVAHGEDNLYDFHKCSEAIRTKNYNKPMSFTKAYGKLYYMGEGGVSNDSVIDEINKGKNIINYRGLGEYNCWPHWNGHWEDFYSSEVYLLNNSTNDVYFCIASSLGSFMANRSFMETFMFTDHGAVSMITASDFTYTYPNNSFNKNLFIKLLDENIYNIGDLNVAAHMATITATTGDEQRKAIFNAFNYFCGGDPSLEIITENTNNFDNYTLSLNGQNLIVNCENISGYKVSIVNENDSLSSVINSTSAMCSLPIPTENFYLVLNKHNYVPRIIYVNVVDSYIQNKVFDDIDVDYYYIKNTTISAGYDVTTSIPYGNVIIESGSKLSINKKNGVRIKNGFKCKTGGELQIK